jgi:hypothetical protein
MADGPAMPGMEPAHQHGAPTGSAAPHEMSSMPDMPGMHEHAMMRGLLGDYPISREASGTAWQPEAAPHEGVHAERGAWSLMAHANVFALYTDQGSDRGESELGSVNMAMGIAQRPLGPGRFGLEGMLSLEPATVGKDGYPLLLQSGETADGVKPLVDRQHPHDFLMELAATYSVALDATDALYVYVGLPGEPALGPAAYMHRFSGMDNPEAPLAHHWLDSTHVAWGVVTAGWAGATWKAEGSLFRGREPDENRWDVETPKLDSQSLRLTWNPSARWSLQASHGWLHSPEQLEPEVDVDRTTASASYVAPPGVTQWGATLAWGRNARHPGVTSNALLLEGALHWGGDGGGRGRNTLFARAERLENDELVAALVANGVSVDAPADLPGSTRVAVVTVGEVSTGYLRDVARGGQWTFAAGGSVRVSLLPADLEPIYGARRPLSWLLMLRAALR